MASFRVGSRGRRRNIPGTVYLPEARASANAVGQVLVAKYGKHPWILQVMEAVQGAVQRGIEQLGASQAPAQNAMPGDIQNQGYAMPARTAADVTPGFIAAPSDNPAPNPQQVERAMQAQDMDMFAQLAQVADPTTQQLGRGVPGQPTPQPMREAPMTQGGLTLPSGPSPQEVNVEGTDPGHDNNSVSWLL